MKILILGNGFDIAHGLPTRYSDFLEFAQRASRIYTFKPEARLSDYDLKDWSAKEQIKEQLRKSFENRKKTRDNTVTVNERLDKFYYDCIKNNVWYKYILELHRTNKTRGKNWIDFESEISLAIQAIDETHTSLDQTFFELKNFLGRENRKDSETSETNIETNEELKTKLATFSSIYSLAFKEDKGTVGDLRSRLYSDLEKLIFALEIYLTDFVETLDVSPLSKIRYMTPDYVISFNYTKTYERLYLKNENTYKVCHIHGVCRKTQEKKNNNMVLGIDEYLQGDERFKRTDFSIFKKFVQRIRNHNDINYVSWYNQIEQDIKSKQYSNAEVHIYGHSLDVTDKDILKRFILSPYTMVRIYAHDKPTEGELISHLLRYVDEETLIEKATTYSSHDHCKLEFVVPVVGEGK